jgi:hypothetical protein
MTSSSKPSVRPIKEDNKKVDLSMRARQLVSTVRQGRLITISILDEDFLTGYLCGWDDDTYFLIYPNSTLGKDPVKVLIPKGNILFIQLHDEQTFQEEEDHHKMVGIVKPFKDLLNKQYFVTN